MPSMVSVILVGPSVTSGVLLLLSRPSAITPSPMSRSPAVTACLFHCERRVWALPPAVTVSVVPSGRVLLSLGTVPMGQAM